MKDIVLNLRGTRAFDRKAGQVITLAAAGVLGAIGVPASSAGVQTPTGAPHPAAHHAVAAPAHHAPRKARAATAAHARVRHHRSIWATRWAKLHPAEEALYQKSIAEHRWSAHHHVAKIAARHTRKSAAVRSWARRAPAVTQTLAIRPMPHAPMAVRAIAQPIRVATVSLNPRGLLDAKSVVKQVTRRIGNPDDVTLDFVAADINDILKALAVQTHENIVSGNDVKGTITVSLAHVTLDEALDMITRLSGYEYAKVGRTYVVGSPASIATLAASGTAAVPPTTGVITFNYSDPTDISNVIKQLLPDVRATPGKAVGNSGAGGVLVVTGTESDVDQARQIVAQAESALSKGIASSVTEVYNIKYADAGDLQAVLSRLVPGLVVTPGPTQGFRLKAPVTADAVSTTSTTTALGTAPAGGTVTSITGNLPTSPTTPSLLLTGSDGDIARARAILAQVDVRPAQINFEAKVTEINLTGQKNIGLNWDFSKATTRIGENTDNIAHPPPTLGDNGKNGNILKFGVFGRTAISSLANVSLDALFKSGDAKLLANPNISAVDGQQAGVFIGDTIKYVSSITTSPTGQNITTDTVSAGIKLYVTGKVNNDGYITLNLHPEVSTVTFQSSIGGSVLPQISTREATTTVRVKDGDTIAIGGLINEQDIKNISKVPFFGDLPFFGNLFRDTQHTHNRDEVVIFIKVSIAKDQA